MPHFDEAMRRLREEAKTKTQAGRAFERLMKAAFERHPAEWGPLRFRHIWLWSEWRDECQRRGEADPGPDIGIDLVAEQTPAFGGGLCAIQCKNHATRAAATDGVDKFLAATANTETWKHRVFVATTGFSQNAQKKLAEAGNATLLTGPQLDCWAVGDWRHLVVNIDSLRFDDAERYTPRHDQEVALAAIKEGLFDTPMSQGGSRGTVIMPCGTGKSVVTLWAAERNVGIGGRVLYLVPSIALLGQTMREWASQQTVMPRYLGVCSDTKAGRDSEDVDMSELALPVTTDVTKIASELKRVEPEAMTVVFSTYQSLAKIVDAQEHGAPAFDLVVCDEAHRTAGHDDASGEQTAFTLVHDASRLRALRRLYVTATPRVYSDKTQTKADDLGIDLYSMEDETVFGERLYQMGFAEAVERDLLTDYQVVVVAVDDSPLGGAATSDSAGDLNTEQVQQLLGCWDGLADPNTHRRPGDRPAGVVNPKGASHVARAIAFTNTIKHSKNVAEHWWATMKDEHEKNAEQYDKWRRAQERNAQGQHGTDSITELDVEHVDGKMNAYERARQITWLREVGDDSDESKSSRPVAKVLSNARCLTEGVDVPALDAVLFLSPRKSEIDVVQAVGRVMRKADGKETGYVILPVLVPPGKTGDAPDVLASSAYKGVWQVLRALRAHDERMEGYLASPSLAGRKAPVQLIDNTSAAKERTDDIDEPSHVEQTLPLGLPLTVAAAIVERVGDRQYWARWGDQVNRIVNTVASRIDAAVHDPQRPEMQQVFAEFAAEFRQAVRVDHLSDNELVQTLASHIVTAPVLDALFAGEDFAKSNPMSRALEAARAKLLAEDGDSGAGVDPLRLKVELQQLRRFHDRMERQLGELTDPDDRLEALRSLYESFFQKAMPDAAAQLGIAYTNQRVVDFMLRSVDAAIKHHLGRPEGIGGLGVDVLDPFTGTGTFIYRLLTGKNSDGDWLIPDANLDAKYGAVTSTSSDPSTSGETASGPNTGVSPELHANELLLLAYYVAALKIEDGYRWRKAASGGPVPVGLDTAFRSLALVDTFNSAPPGNPSAPLNASDATLPFRNHDFEANSQIHAGRTDPFLVVVGNPPWSAGQKSSGDDNPNIDYPNMDTRIAGTYGEWARRIGLPAGKAHGNLYVLAFRWAADQLDEEHGGVVAFVHPNSLLEGTSLAGMRSCLRSEFDYTYVVDLRGNAYKSGADWELEGDKVFEQASRNGVQVSVAVRLPMRVRTESAGTVRLARCAERLTREQKLDWLDELQNIMSDQFMEVPESPRHDWVNISDGTYELLLPVTASKLSAGKTNAESACQIDALGVTTALDECVYDYSRAGLQIKIEALMSAFNEAYDESLSYLLLPASAGKLTRDERAQVESCVRGVTSNDDRGRIKWTDRLKSSLKVAVVLHLESGGVEDGRLTFDEDRIRLCQYRPFQQLWLYWDDRILSSCKAVGKLFPHDATDAVTTGLETAPPPQERFLSPARPTRQSSESSRPTRSPTSAQRGHSRPAEQQFAGWHPHPQRSERPEAILITAPSGRTVFGVVGCRDVPNLCGAGSNQPCRATVRYF